MSDCDVRVNAKRDSAAVTSLWSGAIPPLLMIAGILFHPTQITIPQWINLLVQVTGVGASVARAVPSINLTVSDILFLAGFASWVGYRWHDGTLLARLRSYPWALLGLFAASILSALPFLKSSPSWASPPAVEASRSVKQLIQLGLFFVCAFIPLSDYLRNRQWRRKLLTAFALAAVIALLVGLNEYMTLRPPSPEALRDGKNVSALHLDATFGVTGESAGAHEQIGTQSNRNVLGAWLTLVIPLFWAAFLWADDTGGRGICLIMCAIGGTLLLQGGLWIAVVVSILALSFARGRGVFLISAACLFLFFGALFSLCPQKPGAILLDSVMLRRSSDQFRTLSVYSINPELDESGRSASLEQEPYSPWEQKHIQWQPSLLALARHPLVGVGLGNYQKNINRYYTDRDYGAYNMPKASMDLMEKGGNPFYAVWASETGFIGLFSVLWAFMTFFYRAYCGARSAARREKGLEFSLQIGVCAALGAAAFGGLFTNYMVRGLGYTVVFILALAGATSCDETEEGDLISPP